LRSLEKNGISIEKNIHNVPFIRPHSVIKSRHRIPAKQIVQRPLTAPTSKSKIGDIFKVSESNQKTTQQLSIPVKNEVLPSGVDIFDDEKLRKIYLDTCSERDSIPKHSFEKIELLKRVILYFKYLNYKALFKIDNHLIEDRSSVCQEI